MKNLKTIDELYELDRDELMEYFQEAFQVSIGEHSNSDLQITTLHTADGYDVYGLINGDYLSDINWESDIYYNEPPIEDILDRIIECGVDATIYCYDMEEVFMDEGAIIDCLENNEFTKEEDDE